MDAAQFLENIVHFDSDTLALHTGRKREEVTGLVTLVSALMRGMCLAPILHESSREQDAIHALES
jgi:hypothetical protein